MAEPEIVFLMYHELELPGRPRIQSDPGYVRYVLSASSFRAQMLTLKRQAWRGMSVTEALASPRLPGVAITFDDGCETDLLVAAPILHDNSFGATFYVTAGFLGRPGYMSNSQVRELATLGFEIGCHSMTHAYLSDLDAAGLQREVVEAKACLEQILGRPVEHFSCPGGRYDARTAELARAVGYRTVATSRIQANGRKADPYALARVPVFRGTGSEQFMKICRARGLWRLGLSQTLRVAARKSLGNSLYDRLRAVLLRSPSSPD